MQTAHQIAAQSARQANVAEALRIRTSYPQAAIAAADELELLDMAQDDERGPWGNAYREQVIQIIARAIKFA
jgi:hypothetical protein